MKKFDDREKRHDRIVNRLYIHYRKYQSKETCPTCNLKYPLKMMLEVNFDRRRKRIVKRKWVHNEEKCYRFFISIVMGIQYNRHGKYYSDRQITKIADIGLRRYRRMDRKFTEKGE